MLSFFIDKDMSDKLYIWRRTYILWDIRIELIGKEIQIEIFNFLALHVTLSTVQKMKLSIKDFFSKCDQNHSFLRIWSHLVKKSLTENFIFRAVVIMKYLRIDFSYELLRIAKKYFYARPRFTLKSRVVIFM